MTLNENQENMLKLSYYGMSDIGLVRSENQDSMGKFPSDDVNLYSSKGQLFIVADGVGGHTGGKEASSTAIETISTFYFNSSLNDEDAIREAVYEANNRIYNKAQNSPQIGRMATTCSILLLKGNDAVIGHVGDSRIYKIENGIIEQLTTDHTKVHEMLKEGILTKEEAENYPSKSVLARAVGAEKNIKVDVINNIILKNGQSYVLCSDGLSKVNPKEIQDIVSQNPPKKSCDILISLANERGGKDNVTVQVIKIEEQNIIVDPYPLEGKKKFPKKALWFTLIIIILLLVGYVLKDSILLSNSNRDAGDSTIIKEQSNLIVKKEPIEENNNNLDSVITEANKQFNKGRIERAHQMYKDVLDKDPLHLAALKGINNISEVYYKRAIRSMNDKKFKEALINLNKVAEIQPENAGVINLIRICERQLQNPSNDTLKTELNKLDSSFNKNN